MRCLQVDVRSTTRTTIFASMTPQGSDRLPNYVAHGSEITCGAPLQHIMQVLIPRKYHDLSRFHVRWTLCFSFCSWLSVLPTTQPACLECFAKIYKVLLSLCPYYLQVAESSILCIDSCSWLSSAPRIPLRRSQSSYQHMCISFLGFVTFQQAIHVAQSCSSLRSHPWPPHHSDRETHLQCLGRIPMHRSFLSLQGYPSAPFV